MNKLKKLLLPFLSATVLMSSATMAQEFKNPDGTAPIAQWTVIHATAGQMRAIQELDARYITSYVTNEPGTYALYGAVDKANPDTLRVLEVYKNQEAYIQHATNKGFQAYQEKRNPIINNMKILETTPLALYQKDQGTGTVVTMHLIHVNPQHLDQYTRLIKQEMQRAIADDTGVLGMFATAEKENPYVIHTMEIFTDNAAHQAYYTSRQYHVFHTASSPLITKRTEIENLPASITLSTKGLQYIHE